MMSDLRAGRAWQGVLEHLPVSGRAEKPRSTGHTMVLDKGLGISATRDLLELAGEYIDLIKLGFGTSAFYPEHLLRQKIHMIRSHGVDVCPGGTFLEAALLQGRLPEYLARAEDLGFTCVEISDGTITLDQTTRSACLQLVKAAGFRVTTEVGKKDTAEQTSMLAMSHQISLDLSEGADQVIVEARESGRGVGIFDAAGELQPDLLFGLLGGILQPERIIWEAPLKSQQVELIRRFGPNVNLGNISPAEVIALEALRSGLRGDTLQLAVRGRQQAPVEDSFAEEH